MLETQFSVVNLVAFTGWLGLAIAAPMSPNRLRNGILFVSGRAVPLVLCLAYVVFLARHWGTAPGGGFQSLGAVQVLFTSPGLALGGWTHYLAFDLLIGRWMVDDASSSDRSRIPLVLALPATFLFGPAGVLLYVAGQSLHRFVASHRRE